MTACLTVTGAIVVPLTTFAFVLTVIVLRMREHRNELQYRLGRAVERVERQRQILSGGGVGIFAWNWPQRLADKGSANPVAESSNDCYSSTMEMAKEG